MSDEQKKDEYEDGSFFSASDIYIIGPLVILLIFIVAIQAAVYQPPIKEEYKVTTKAGEIYSFKTEHLCGKHLAKAAKQVYGMQDQPLTKVGLKELPSVVKNLTYIYDGKVKETTRCDIRKFEVKPIKQVKPKKEVKK